MIGQSIQWLRNLRDDERGAAAIEFGLIITVFLSFLFIVFDLGHMTYARSVLNGAVEKAARAASLETGDPEVVDQMVEDAMRPVLPGVVISTTRKSYSTLRDVKRGEQYTDANDNGECDNNESYTDLNNNSRQDDDIGMTGNGGASDVVVYQVTATYTPVFKVPVLPGAWSERTMTASSIKINQPYAEQAPRAASTPRSCP